MSSAYLRETQERASDPLIHECLGHYKCACGTGYTEDFCEQESDECLSSPCVHGTCIDIFNGYRCACRQGYVGKLCDELEQTTPDVGEERGQWGSWSGFSECSRPCDYGFKVRQRVCMDLPCSGEGSQVKDCNALSCPRKNISMETEVPFCISFAEELILVV